MALPEVTVRALRAHKLQQTAERLRAGSRWVDRDLVFMTRTGTPISASNLVNRNFKPLLERAGSRADSGSRICATPPRRSSWRRVYRCES